MLRVLCVLSAVLIATPAGAGLAEDIADLKKNPSRAAWDRLAANGPDALLPILRAWPKDDPVAANWLRTAFDRIAESHEHKLPVDDLHAYAADETAPGRPRRLALGALERGRPGTTATLMANWLNDPVFGPDAVALRIAEAEKATDPADAKRLLQTAFAAATDIEQVQLLAKKLTAAGDKVDVPKKLGVVTAWQVVGPFAVTPADGLKQSFPPEAKLDFADVYAGGLKWKAAAADPLDGKLDLVKLGISPDKGAVAYAATHVTVAAATKAEVRISVVDNVTAWVNGKEVVKVASLFRSHYRADRHRATVELPAGRSTILLKFTKTPPEEGGRPGAPARWDFLARLVDAKKTGLTFTPMQDSK